MKADSSAAPSLMSRLSVGATWNLVAAIFNQGSVFAVNIIIARLLGRTLFGEYTIIQSTLLTISLLAQVSTGMTATQYLAEFRVCDRDRAGRILSLCAIVSAITGALAVILLFFLAPWLSDHILKAPHLSLSLRIGGVFLFFAVINGYQIGALAGLENFKNLAKAGLCNSGLMVPLCSLGAWHWGINGALTGFAISAMVNWIIHQHFLKAATREQGIFASYHGLWRERRVLSKFALPAALSGFISTPALWLANVFLVRSPNGYNEMAMYSAGMNIRTLILVLPRNINNVSCSILNYHKGLVHEIEYRRTYWINLIITSVLVLAGGIAVFFGGQRILGLFGKSFEEASPVLLILLLSGIIEIVAVSLYQVMQTKKMMWLTLFLVAIPNYVTVVILAYLIAPQLGAMGLAWAYTAGWAIALLGISLVIKKTGVTL
jgi:O-antigen/teichoic acid export membrane protein